jgi:hypothetical protein
MKATNEELEALRDAIDELELNLNIVDEPESIEAYTNQINHLNNLLIKLS